MLDTLKLSLMDYEIALDANVEVRPPSFNPATGEVKGLSPLWRSGGQTVVGSKAYHNADDFNVTVQPLNASEPECIGCYVQFSVPKVANGSNYQAADFRDTKAALTTIERELKSIGISTNINTAKISRLDSCKGVQTQEPYEAYQPILAMLQGQRMAKREYGTTFLWHNTMQEICVYDKLEEMKRRKKSLKGTPQNCLRFEHRMLKARKVRDVLGISNVTDLMDGFEQVKRGYKEAMEKQLFRHSPVEVEYLAAGDIEKQLRDFQSAGNRYFVQDWLNAFAFQHLGTDKGAFLRAVESVSDSRKTLWRLKKKLTEEQMNALSLEIVAPSKHTLGELYRELEREVLAA